EEGRLGAQLEAQARLVEAQEFDSDLEPGAHSILAAGEFLALRHAQDGVLEAGPHEGDQLPGLVNHRPPTPIPNIPASSSAGLPPAKRRSARTPRFGVSKAQRRARPPPAKTSVPGTEMVRRPRPKRCSPSFFRRVRTSSPTR